MAPSRSSRRDTICHVRPPRLCAPVPRQLGILHTGYNLCILAGRTPRPRERGDMHVQRVRRVVALMLVMAATATAHGQADTSRARRERPAMVACPWPTSAATAGATDPQ